MTSFAFSCVADKPPALLAQTFIWVNCLKRLRSINPRDIFVHVVEVEDRDFLDWLKGEQVNIVSAERFDRRSPHCNKLQQLRTFEGSAYDQIVLMDCDTAWVGNTPLPSGAPVAACIVDHANPPERILLNIFNTSGLGAPKWMRVSVGRGGAPEYTDVNNCNGGLYICDAAFLPKLDRAWRFWANWCLDRSALFESAAVHVDQVSFALAMRELRANVAHLPLAWNYPIHLPGSLLPDPSPEILHYHSELHGDLRLKAPGIPQVDRAVEQLNAGIAEFLRPNPLPELRQKFAESRTAKSAGDTNIAAQASFVPVAAPVVKHAPGRSRFGKVVVGSGWWCDKTPHEWAIGSPATRSVEFFELWYRQVVRCLEPDRIVVTDMTSPIKPAYAAYPIQWIELDQNYGHPNDIRVGRIATKYSGFTRSVINGAAYALCCDADFFVYVEQDCLIHGDEFLGHAIGDTTADILLGAPTENGKGLGGAVAATMLQQSLIIVRRAGLERFLIGLLGAPWTDGEVSPEEIMRRRLPPFDLVQVPYGRSRPIDFTRSHFYVEHLDDGELELFLQCTQSELLAGAPGSPPRSTTTRSATSAMQRLREVGAHDFNALLAFKRELVGKLGVHEAFDVYRELDIPNSGRIELGRLESQHAYASSQAECFVELAPAGETFVVPAPILIGEGHAPALCNTSRSLYVACFADARIRGRSGVIQIDGLGLLDFQGSELADANWDFDLDPAIFHGTSESAWLIEPDRRGDSMELETALTLQGLNTGAFGDWMMHFLPKYIAGDCSGVLPKVPVLVPELPETIRECLRLMLPEDVEIVCLPCFATARVRRLWCVPNITCAEVREKLDGPFAFQTRTPPPARFANITREISRRAKLHIQGNNGPERVFLARRGSGWRKLVNQPQIVAIAAANGFRVAYPEDLSFRDQVNLVRDARFIAAAEGSAIFLSYFARQGMRLCILNHTADEWCAMYNGLLAGVGVEITVFTGPIVSRSGPHSVNSDYRIDEAEFSRFLVRWLEESRPAGCSGF